MHLSLTIAPALARISSPVQPRLVEVSAPAQVYRRRVGLVLSVALHLSLVAAALRPAMPLTVPLAAPAAFNVVFQAVPKAAPSVAPDTRLPARLPPTLPQAAARRLPAQATHAPPRAAGINAIRPHAVFPRRSGQTAHLVPLAEPSPLDAAASTPAEAQGPVLAPVPDPVPVPAPVSDRLPAPDPTALASLEARIDRAVTAAKAYPEIARRLRMQGRSEISFSYRDGVVTGLALTRSSAQDMLDRAALDAVRRATYPPPPPAMAHRVLQLAVWLDFSLRQSDW